MNRFNALVALTALLVPAVVQADEPQSSGAVKRSAAPVRRADSSARVVRKSRPEALPEPTRRVPKRGTGVQQAAHVAHQEVVQGELIQEHGHEGEVVHEEGHLHGSGCTSCGGDGCTSCGEFGAVPCDLGCCDTCFQPHRLCICLPAHGWAHMEYMMAWADPMNVPPLAIQGDGPDVPFVGDGNAQVLLGRGNVNGRDEMLGDRRAGGRLRFGWWLAKHPCWAIEGEYLSLGNATETFLAQTNGNPLLAVPFLEMDPRLLNLLAPGETNESGKALNRIGYTARSRLDGGAFHFRRSLCCSSSCGPGWFHCEPVPVQTRFDGFFGYRYLQLKESLQGDYTGIVGNPIQTISITDNFSTMNQFNGADFGVQWQGRRGYWSADLLMRMAIGNSKQQVRIRGNSMITTNNGANVIGNFPNSGFFAAASNSGVYERDTLAVIPELGATIGYQLTPRIRLTTGYSFIYWSSVVRPGDQIDREINSANIPAFLGGAAAPNPRIVPDKPQFEFKETDYWVQSLNLGGEYRW